MITIGRAVLGRQSQRCPFHLPAALDQQIGRHAEPHHRIPPPLFQTYSRTAEKLIIRAMD